MDRVQALKCFLKNNWPAVAGTLAFLLLAYFPLFQRLDAGTLYNWDEGLRAMNAYDMVQTGDPIVVHFDGEPELINTKPPLVLWLIALSMKTLGFSTLAVRLPVALAGMATVISLLVFSIKVLKSWWPGVSSALVLLTSYGFVGRHIIRTADIDGVLVLWITLTCLSYFRFLIAQEGAQRYLVWAGGFLGLAALTKGVAAFLIMPGLFLYTWLTGQLKRVFQSKAFYIAALGLVVVIGSYLAIREFMQDGYLMAMGENDLWGRFGEVKGGHQEPWYFYLKALFTGSELRGPLFMPWVWIILPSFIANLFHPVSIYRKLNIFCGFSSLFFLVIISLSSTKIYWYAAPIFPLLAFIIGISFHLVTQKLSQFGYQSVWKNRLVPLFLLSAIYVVPYYQTIDRITSAGSKGWNEIQYEAYFKQLADEAPQYRTFTALSTFSRNGHLHFWQSVFNNHRGYQITVKRPSDSFEVGQILLTCKKGWHQDLKKKFETKVLHESSNCTTFRLLKK